MLRKAFLMPNFSKRIWITGEAELVVQEPFEEIEQAESSASLMPTNTVLPSALSASLAGAVRITCLAPATRCAEAFS